MVRIENECVGCDYPCIGKRACPLTHVRRFYCDVCHDEADTLYWYGSQQWCRECIIKLLKVDADDVEEEFDEVYEDEDCGADDWSED